jgi:hypothetical protein
MHRPYRHGRELLHRAVYSLAASPETLPKRLQRAYADHLQQLRDGDVPPSLLPQVVAIRERMIRREGTRFGGGVGGVVVSVSRGGVGGIAVSTAGEEARRLVKEIVDLYDAVTRQDAIDEASS